MVITGVLGKNNEEAMAILTTVENRNESFFLESVNYSLSVNFTEKVSLATEARLTLTE